MATRTRIGLVFLVLCMGLAACATTLGDDDLDLRHAIKHAQVWRMAYRKAAHAKTTPEELNRISRNLLKADLAVSNTREHSIRACWEYLKREDVAAGGE